MLTVSWLGVRWVSVDTSTRHTRRARWEATTHLTAAMAPFHVSRPARHVGRRGARIHPFLSGVVVRWREMWVWMLRELGWMRG